MIHAPQFACAAHARLHFINDQQKTMLFGQRAQHLHIALRTVRNKLAQYRAEGFEIPPSVRYGRVSRPSSTHRSRRLGM